MGKMFRAFVFLLVCSFMSVSVFADNTNIKGKIVDGTGKPIEGAVASCLSLADSTLVANAITDSIGVFNIIVGDSAADNSFIIVSCVGYERKEIVLGKETRDDVLVTLKETAHQLKGVTVTAKSRIEGLPGGYSFTPGGAEMLLEDGYTLLKVTPMLNVDGRSISIIGKGDAKIYINGKDPHMPADMVLDMLYTVEPKSIKRIDIMYNPGASQRASDQRGIVNVVMNRPDYGWTGRADLYGGLQNKRLSESGGTYLGYGHGPFKFSANIRLDDTRGVTESEYGYDYKSDAISVLNTGRAESKSFSGSINMNAVYEIDSKSDIGLSVATSLKRSTSANETSILLKNGKEGTGNSGTQTSEYKTPTRLPGYSLLAFYSLKPGKLSTFEANVSYSNRKNRTTGNVKIPSGMGMDSWLAAPYEEFDRSAAHGFGVEVKYTKMFANGGYIGFGGAYDISHVDDDGRFSDLVDGVYVDNALRSNRFLYDENVAGAYVDYSRDWTSFFSSTIGLRVEQTHIHGDQRSTGETFTRDYLQFFPNVSLSFNTLNQKNIFGINYSVSGWRSPFTRLNPFKYWTSPNTYRVGNPNLKPGKFHFLSLSYRFLQWYEVAVRALISPNVVTSYTTQEGNGVSKTGYGDLGNSKGVGFMFSAYRSFWGGRYYVNAEASFGYDRMKGNVENDLVNRRYWGGGCTLTNTFFINKARDFGLLLFYDFSAKRHEMAEARPAKHIIAAKISKTFAFGGTLEIGYGDEFPRKYKCSYETPSYYYQSRSLTSSARVSVSFSQKFGKKRVRGAAKRSNFKFESRMDDDSKK